MMRLIMTFEVAYTIHVWRYSAIVQQKLDEKLRVKRLPGTWVQDEESAVAYTETVIRETNIKNLCSQVTI
jgi:hypothetical protein